jgi:hypothetical protein
MILDQVSSHALLYAEENIIPVIKDYDTGEKHGQLQITPASTSSNSVE